MKKTLLINALFIVILFLFTSSLSAVTYYVDYDSGSDTNDGLTTSTSWKHYPGDDNATDNPASIQLQPGDNICFKGGVTYKGEIVIEYDGSQDNPIVFKGDGWGSEKAVLDGADDLSLTWTQCSSADECGGNPDYNNIYYAEVPEEFDFFDGLYEDDNYLWFSQDPNPGDRYNYDRIEDFYEIPLGRPFTTTTLTDSAYFTQSDSNFWDGAYLLVWHIPNITTPRIITGYDPDTYTITFEEIGGGGIYTDRSSFFSMLNHPVLIDTAGEYAVDTTINRIYLWPLQSNDPNQNSYSCKTRHTAIKYNHRKHIVIEGFEIKNYVMGIRSQYDDAEDVIIRNNLVKNLRSNDWYAIQVNGKQIVVESNRVEDCIRAVGILAAGDSIIIRNNYVKNTSRQGIWFMGVHHGSIINNIVTDIRGTHSNAISAYLYNEDILVAGNQVYNSNIGLTYHGHNNMPDLFMNLTVYNNCFDPACHSWGKNARGITIINNTCKNGFFTNDTITTSINNIFHAGGDADLRSNNIYTDLAWSQKERYGWSLQEGEIDWSERDIDSVYKDIGNNEFQLIEGSPAIDSGIDPIAYLPVDLFPEYNFYTDIFGNPRPYGEGWDIGAYEYNGETGIENISNLPDKYALYQNYPNPFNPTTTIEYQVSAICEVELSIYNILGQKVATLVNKKQPAGSYKVKFDGSNLASGVYLYCLKTNSGLMLSKKLLLLK